MPRRQIWLQPAMRMRCGCRWKSERLLTMQALNHPMISRIIMKPTRLLALSVLACAFSACSTFHKVTDATLGVFKPKKSPANVEAAMAEPLPPAAENSTSAVMYVDINKSRRKVVIQLDPVTAPKAVANFKKLVNAG